MFSFHTNQIFPFLQSLLINPYSKSLFIMSDTAKAKSSANCKRKFGLACFDVNSNLPLYIPNASISSCYIHPYTVTFHSTSSYEHLNEFPYAIYNPRMPLNGTVCLRCTSSRSQTTKVCFVIKPLSFLYLVLFLSLLCV